VEAKFGDSSLMEPGDWVMAIGNPFGLAHTVSVGVISATSRPFPVAEQRSANVLQTDAAINPGNSGGPLLNIRGEVIGVNTAIYSSGSMIGGAGNIGIGFAIPINTIRDVLPGLRAGKITRGRIGVQVRPVTADDAEAMTLKDRRGAFVAAVTPGGPAAAGGMQAFDVIVEFNGKPVQRSDDLPQVVAATAPGSTVPVKVIRDGKERTLNVRVEELDLETETTRQADAGGTGGDTGGGFGITLNNITPDASRQFEIPSGTRGAVIVEVDPDSPAARVLQPGDVILQVNRQGVSNANEAGTALRAVPAGRAVGLLIMRRGQEQAVTVRKQ
jgi:serine protease Do